MIPHTAPRKQEALRRLMTFEVGTDCDVPASRWYTQQELLVVGGIRYSAQLFSLVRKDPSLAYDCRCVDGPTGRFVYRLRERREGESLPITRRRRTRELETELAEAREELSDCRNELRAYRNAWARLAGEELELLVSAKPVQLGVS